MSIKANELRVGNLVYYGESTRVITQIGVSPQRNFVGVDNMITTFDVISPIPLTPGVLEKAGFARMNYQDSEWRETEWPIIGELCTSDDGVYVFDCDTDKLRITSLHQLQNLYFALTGEELIVKF